LVISFCQSLDPRYEALGFLTIAYAVGLGAVGAYFHGFEIPRIVFQSLVRDTQKLLPKP